MTNQVNVEFDPRNFTIILRSEDCRLGLEATSSTQGIFDRRMASWANTMVPHMSRVGSMLVDYICAVPFRVYVQVCEGDQVIAIMAKGRSSTVNQEAYSAMCARLDDAAWQQHASRFADEFAAASDISFCIGAAAPSA